MQKKPFKKLWEILYFCPIIFIVCLISYSYLFNTHNENQFNAWKDALSKSEKYSLTSFLSSPDKKEIFNRKTPRALFAKFINESLLIWCGYFRDSFQAVECIVNEKPNINDHNELEKYLDKCQMLSLSLLSIDFKYSLIPLSAPGNTLQLTLGTGNEKITYYLAKQNDGNWFFSEKNFENPRIIKLYKNYLVKTENPEYDSLKSPTPLIAYVNFMLGCIDKYDYTFNDALSVLDLKKLPKIIYKKYSKFIAFVLFKVLVSKNTSITSITSEPLDSNIEILYIKPGVGSIYLKKKYF